MILIDHLTASLLSRHWYMPVFYHLERECPVHQLNSIFQDTMKLLMLIGNVIVGISLFIPLVRSFILFSEVIWMVPSLLFHFSWLGDVKQNSVPRSDSNGLALKAKIHASSKGMKDKVTAEVHKFSMVIALETGKHVQHSYQKTADSNQITSQCNSTVITTGNHVRMWMSCN